MLLAAVVFARVIVVVSLLVSGVSNAVKLRVWFCPTTVVVPAIVAVKAIATTTIMMIKNLSYIGRSMQA
jgi:hypothetical protein